MTDLRCLSLHQPWASLVAIGAKTIETRSWSTKYRGRIGIASTKRKPAQGVIGEYESYAADPRGQIHPNHAQERPARLYRNCSSDLRLGARWVRLPLGALVATANLVDCVQILKVRDDGTWTVLREYRAGRMALPATILDQLPYGDFTPGRWAWLLDDVKATTERCPACWGTGWIPDDPRCPDSSASGCPVCTPVGGCGGKDACDPIPVKGHQGLWTWAVNA